MTKRVNQPLIAVGAGVVMVTLSSVASAQSSPSVTCSGSCVTTQGTAATQLISTTTVQQMLTISNAIGSRMVSFSPPPSSVRADSGQRFGMAAGGSDKWNVWGSYSGDNNRYDNGTALFSADARTAVIGGDYSMAPDLALGMSVAFDTIDGQKSTTVNYTSAGNTFAPYLGWQISKDLSLDASIGWGNGKLQGNDLSEDKSSRLFYGANLNYTTWSGNWQLSGKGSYLHGEEKYKDRVVNGVTTVNSATTNKVSQWRLGGQAAYWMDGTMPYVGLTYSSDNRSVSNPGAGQTDDLGKNGWLWSLGVNFISLKSSVTGGIAYNQETGRSNSKRNGVMANINMRF